MATQKPRKTLPVKHVFSNDPDAPQKILSQNPDALVLDLRTGNVSPTQVDAIRTGSDIPVTRTDGATISFRGTGGVVVTKPATPHNVPADGPPPADPGDAPAPTGTLRRYTTAFDQFTADGFHEPGERDDALPITHIRSRPQQPRDVLHSVETAAVHRLNLLRGNGYATYPRLLTGDHDVPAAILDHHRNNPRHADTTGSQAHLVASWMKANDTATAHCIPLATLIRAGNHLSDRLNTLTHAGKPVIDPTTWTPPDQAGYAVFPDGLPVPTRTERTTSGIEIVAFTYQATGPRTGYEHQPSRLVDPTRSAEVPHYQRRIVDYASPVRDEVVTTAWFIDNTKNQGTSPLPIVGCLNFPLPDTLPDLLNHDGVYTETHPSLSQSSYLFITSYAVTTAWLLTHGRRSKGPLWQPGTRHGTPTRIHTLAWTQADESNTSSAQERREERTRRLAKEQEDREQAIRRRDEELAERRRQEKAQRLAAYAAEREAEQATQQAIAQATSGFPSDTSLTPQQWKAFLMTSPVHTPVTLAAVVRQLPGWEVSETTTGWKIGRLGQGSVQVRRSYPSDQQYHSMLKRLVKSGLDEALAALSITTSAFLPEAASNAVASIREDARSQHAAEPDARHEPDEPDADVSEAVAKYEAAARAATTPGTPGRKKSATEATQETEETHEPDNPEQAVTKPTGPTRPTHTTAQEPQATSPATEPVRPTPPAPAPTPRATNGRTTHTPKDTPMTDHLADPFGATTGNGTPVPGPRTSVRDALTDALNTAERQDADALRDRVAELERQLAAEKAKPPLTPATPTPGQLAAQAAQAARAAEPTDLPLATNLGTSHDGIDEFNPEDDLTARHVGYLTITPELADTWIKRTTCNTRPYARSRAEGFADTMRGGLWSPTHQGLALDTHGCILDGRHRAEAVRIAGVPIVMMVSTGRPPEEFVHYDSGKPRSARDTLAILTGRTRYGTTIAAAYRVLAARDKGLPVGNWSRAAFPNEELVEAVKNYDLDPYIDRAALQFNSIGASVSGTLIGIYLLSQHYTEAEMTPFETAVASGLGLTVETDPRHVLRNRYLNNRKLAGTAQRRRIDAVEGAALWIKGFNAWIQGRPMQIITWSKATEKFPAIHTKNTTPDAP